ncbi:MAG: DnaJ domain-containing protein [Chloroflexota bacterium]
MTNSIARWIRATFAVVPDVSRASIEPDPSVIYKTHRADVVVSTWMGARLYIYLIEKAPKVREIKSILRDNSRSGIGTLFLVDRNLLPADDSQLKMQDWWEALSSLHHDFIYTYFFDDDELHITQAHFTPINGKDVFRTWYLPEFAIEKVTVRRRNVITGNVKGRWHLGDIASPDYKRKMGDERANQRFHYRTKYTQDIPNGKANQVGSNAVRDMKLSRYYKLIGVQQGASEKEIKTAFRQMAMKVHPDVSALPRQEATERIKQLNEAYEYIKEYHGWK